MYNTLNSKLSNFKKKIPDASTLIQTSQYNTDKQNLEKKIGDAENKTPDISGLASSDLLNAKIGEFENKIPCVSGLVTTGILNIKIREVKNEIPDVSRLVKKADYDAKIKDIKGKYFTSDYNKFTSDILDSKLKQIKLVSEFNISDLSTKLATLKAKAELKEEQCQILKLQMHDLSHFLCKIFLVMMVSRICLFINQHLMR